MGIQENIEKIYPNCRVVGLVEIFIPYKGWVDVNYGLDSDNPMNEIGSIIANGCDPFNRKITHVELILEHEDKTRRNVDFSIKELQR